MRYFIFLFLLGFYSLSFVPALAAIVKVDTEFNSLHVGDVFTVEVLVDTEKVTLNAVEVGTAFPAELLEYQASDDGDSVVNLWVEKPSYKEPNLVSFSGITPGGFSGDKVSLLAITFKVLAVGQGNIEINQAKLLMHDGLGTEAPVTNQNLHFSVSEGEASTNVNTIDDELPESFVPEIINDRDVYDGKYSLIFSTEDKGSGLDHYEVKEGLFGLYKKAVSPYLLEYQQLNKKIVVRAIDRLGNKRVEVLYPQNWKPRYEHAGVIVSIITLCVLIVLTLGRFVILSLKK
jgi:hypothetical protein